MPEPQLPVAVKIEPQDVEKPPKILHDIVHVNPTGKVRLVAEGQPAVLRCPVA